MIPYSSTAATCGGFPYPEHLPLHLPGTRLTCYEPVATIFPWATLLKWLQRLGAGFPSASRVRGCFFT